ncbi:MAG: hybrid sensor histidine kinase/response regulator [Candidatus Omnitrophica bacterium]|nr:hybrid sensor histidine kinase/response regulator [Candidatus Omnitrophota bacterium]
MNIFREETEQGNIDVTDSTILVVDDEPEILNIVVNGFSRFGFKMVTALNGEDALEIVAKDKIDLILLDIMMPGINGFDVLKKIRDNKQTWHIPVIMVTALNAPNDRIRGIEAGCHDFISKPFILEELLAKTRFLLKIKFLYEQLERSYEKLKSLEIMKDNLTHMVIHDLKNPLNTILLGLEFLQKRFQSKLAPEEKISLAVALRACYELKAIMDDLLDINKMEAGKIKLRLEKFDLAVLITEVIEQMKVIIVDSSKVLSSQIDKKMPEICADRKIIKRVIANIVNNAVKFTPSNGTILIKASFDKASNNFCVQIKDSGEGIPEEYLETIFDKFVQLNNNKFNVGHGLGLNFCKLMVEAHGGNIRVESKPGKGSNFIFTLPA